MRKMFTFVTFSASFLLIKVFMRNTNNTLRDQSTNSIEVQVIEQSNTVTKSKIP